MEKIGYFTFYGGQYINLVKKLMFDWKTMYNCVISNLNSKQLVLGLEWKSKIVIFIRKNWQILLTHTSRGLIPLVFIFLCLLLKKLTEIAWKVSKTKGFLKLREKLWYSSLQTGSHLSIQPRPVVGSEKDVEIIKDQFLMLLCLINIENRSSY